jgi:DNA-binding Lrp family transcriptional regulator
MIQLDNIDLNILDSLSRNSRSTATQISKDLSKMGISLTPRAVLNRLKRLEMDRIIQGYIVRLNPNLFETKYSFLILMKFEPSCNNGEVMQLNSILCDSQNCSFATRMIAGSADGFQYAYQLVYDTEQQFDLQFGSIQEKFKDIIVQCQIYKSAIIKESHRVLQPTQDLKRNKISVQSMDESEYQQNLVSQCYNEIAISIARQFHRKLSST